MVSEGPKVKASVETMAYYNTILTEAIFQLLEEKGLLTPLKLRNGWSQGDRLEEAARRGRRAIRSRVDRAA